MFGIYWGTYSTPVVPGINNPNLTACSLNREQISTAYLFRADLFTYGNWCEHVLVGWEMDVVPQMIYCHADEIKLSQHDTWDLSENPLLLQRIHVHCHNIEALSWHMGTASHI